MKKIIIEVGSTNTKIDLYDNNKITRLEEITILFKANFQKSHRLANEDIQKLTEKVLELKKSYQDIYVCGTSIFRELEQTEKLKFLQLFKQETNLDFHIISQKEENELTVVGAIRKVNQKVCVFVGGGGSTEISVAKQNITESTNSKVGVIDITNIFPDLKDDIATTSLEEVKKIISAKLNIPSTKCDILILAGGAHQMFAEVSGISYERNTLYKDENSPIMMSYDQRLKDTLNYYSKTSLKQIKSRVDNPDWWNYTRAMCAFVLVVAEKVQAKYIVPTNISMVYGIINKH